MEMYLYKHINNRNVMYLRTELKGCNHNSNLSPHHGSNTGHASHYVSKFMETVAEKKKLFQNIWMFYENTIPRIN
jgi:hypothetical protein